MESTDGDLVVVEPGVAIHGRFFMQAGEAASGQASSRFSQGQHRPQT